MDEFFASSPPPADPAARAAEGAGEEGTDIRQFTAWLEGLRKK
jgi:hypothetical protein